MHESMISDETWSYECLSCLHEWSERFQVGHGADGHGGAVVYYLHHGQPCTSPWAELRCPSCGGYDAKVLPTTPAHTPPASPPRYGELEMLFRLRRMHAY